MTNFNSTDLADFCTLHIICMKIILITFLISVTDYLVNTTLERKNLFFSLSLRKQSTQVGSSCNRSSREQRLRTHSQAGSREQWMLVLSLCSPCYSVYNTAHGMMLPTFRRGFSSLLKSIPKHPHIYTQNYLSIMILNPIKVTIKTNHFSEKSFTWKLIPWTL